MHLISFRDCLLVFIGRTSSAGKRGRFFCSFSRFYVVKMIKNQKKIKKNQKNAKKFAHIKKKLYLCTRFQNKEIGNTKKTTPKSY